LLLGRAGIGVGEAGFTAPSQAMIVDVFPASQRGTAISIFLLGATVGNLVGPAFGGWAAQAHGWRWAYMMAGLPGIVLVPLAWLTLRDVRRGLSDGIASEHVQSVPFGEAARELLAIRTLPLMMVAMSLNALIIMGLIS